MGRPSFGQSQLTNRSGKIMRQGAKRKESGAVYVGRHDDLHGDGLFSLAKSIFKKGSKAVKAAKKFAKSDLVKKGLKYGKKYGKTALDLGSKAAEFYGSETGQAIKQALIPSESPGFPGEKHGILNRGDGTYVGANWLGPGTNVRKRLERGDGGVTPVDTLAMKHDVAYRKAQGAKSKADQLRMIRKADEDMISGLKKIVSLGADNHMNIKQAQLIIAKLGAEKAGLIAKGSFGGELENISNDEMNLLNKAEKGLTLMGYGKKSHPASNLKKQLARKHKKGKGLNLAGQGKGKGLNLAGQGKGKQRGGNLKAQFDPVGYAQEIMKKSEIQRATAYANEQAKKGKNWKASFARYMKGEVHGEPVAFAKKPSVKKAPPSIEEELEELPYKIKQVDWLRETRQINYRTYNQRKNSLRQRRIQLLEMLDKKERDLKSHSGKGKGKQSGGFIITLAALIAGISTAASAVVSAAPAISAVAGAVGATAGAAVAVKELAGGSLKTVIAKKIKEETKKTKVTTADLPKNIVKAADKKLKTIKNLKIPIKEKKEMVIKQVAKPLIPIVKKKYVEKLAKNLKGDGLKLAGQGLNLAGQGKILTDKKILDGMKKDIK